MADYERARDKQTGLGRRWLLGVGICLLFLLVMVAIILDGRLLSASERAEMPPSLAITRQAAILTEEARPATQVATPAEAPAAILLTRAAAPPSEAAVFEPIPGSTPAGSGYIVEVAPPFSGNEYHIVNEWYRDVDDGRRRIFVFAGSVAGPGGEMTEQGVVIAQVWRMAASEGIGEGATGVETVESNRYLTTVAAGPLRIVGAEGERLILETPGGGRFLFDVGTRQLMEG